MSAKRVLITSHVKGPPALRGCPQLRSIPSLWSGIGEQSRSISRGLKINKNSAEGEVFLVDFPSYRTFQAQRNNFRFARNPPGTSLPLCRLWDQPVNLNASMMCGAKVLNEKICERTNAQDEFKRDA